MPLLLYFPADRAKQIKTKAIVNEDPTEALIRDLKAENEKLKKALASGSVDEKDLKDMADTDNLSKEGQFSNECRLTIGLQLQPRPNYETSFILFVQSWSS